MIQCVTAPAAFLRLIKRSVRIPVKRIEIFAVLWRKSHTDAGRYMPASIGPGMHTVQRLTEVKCLALCPSRVFYSQKCHKFIAADPPEDIGAAEIFPYGLCKRLDDRISEGMAVQVIGLFEFIMTEK